MRYRLFEITDAGNKEEIRIGKGKTIPDAVERSSAKKFHLVGESNTLGPELSGQEVLELVA